MGSRAEKLTHKAWLKPTGQGSSQSARPVYLGGQASAGAGDGEREAGRGDDEIACRGDDPGAVLMPDGDVAEGDPGEPAERDSGQDPEAVPDRPAGARAERGFGLVAGKGIGRERAGWQRRWLDTGEEGQGGGVAVGAAAACWGNVADRSGRNDAREETVVGLGGAVQRGRGLLQVHAHQAGGGGGAEHPPARTHLLQQG